ncbi:MAG: hypothetical protein QM651_12450 [Rhodoblastus sp.]
MAMQRDGNSDDRTKAGASGRTPPVIEGEAVEVSAAGDAPVVAESIVEAHQTAPRDPDSVVEAERVEGVEEAQDVAAPVDGDPIAAPPPERTRRGGFIVFGVLVVAIAGAIAWIAAPGHRVDDGSLKARVIGLLPESAQRALHVAPPAPDTKEAPAPAVDPDAGKTAEAAKPEPAKPESAKSDAVSAAPEPKPAEQTAGQTGGAAVFAAPPVAAAANPRQSEDAQAAADAVQSRVDALQTKLDAALGRIDALQSKLDLAQGKLELTQSKSDAAAAADAVTQAAQRLEALTQRLAVIEQKLEQPKTDTRAPQARENNTPSGREFAASRAVVAQATGEALRAGAPLADNLAALKGLGVADEKTADLAAYAKTGAPTVAQLTQQWRGLRDKVLALDAPSAGASFTDKLLAKAKGVFRITWAGQGAQNSIGGTVARIDAALQKSDLPGAVAACEDFPAVAKNLVADWQIAASARLKADSAARALLSESISAIGRSSSQ